MRVSDVFSNRRISTVISGLHIHTLPQAAFQQRQVNCWETEAAASNHMSSLPPSIHPWINYSLWKMYDTYLAYLIVQGFQVPEIKTFSVLLKHWWPVSNIVCKQISNCHSLVGLFLHLKKCLLLPTQSRSAKPSKNDRTNFFLRFSSPLKHPNMQKETRANTINKDIRRQNQWH